MVSQRETMMWLGDKERRMSRKDTEYGVCDEMTKRNAKKPVKLNTPVGASGRDPDLNRLKLKLDPECQASG